MSVAAPAQGLSAQEHGSRLFRPLGVGRDAGADARGALYRLARQGGSGGEPLGGDHRQPERPIDAKGGPAVDPIGYDAGKKVKGIKRHVLTDHLGLLLSVAVHPADVQDRDGAAALINKRVRRRFPFIEVIFADTGYQGERVRQTARKSGCWRVEIVKRAQDAQGFVVVAKRWIVERTLAWISRNRRLARDFENLARTAAALVRLAMIKIMLRRLARP